LSKAAEYLKKAITGETNATKMYLKFSEIAKEQGFNKTAYLFMALRDAETIHIKNHLKALGDEKYTPEKGNFKTGSTEENLITAIEGETYEYKKMYPEFLKAIKSEIKTEYGRIAELSMLWALKTEKTHAKLLKAALKYIKRAEDFDTDGIHVCRVCGNLFSGKEAPGDVCPVCGHDAQFYNRVQNIEA